MVWNRDFDRFVILSRMYLLFFLKTCTDFVTLLNLCRPGLYGPAGDFLDVKSFPKDIICTGMF